MASRGISDAEFERQYRAVKSAKPKPELQAESASYDQDAKQLVIKLKNGSTISTPLALLGEFEGADPEDIAAIELTPRGEALHWEKLDQDFSVGGLISSVFGREAYMAELGRKGGSVTTDAKAAAARENGRKGGRPLKVREGTFSPAPEAGIQVLGKLLQAQIELIDAVLNGSSHQETKDLAKYDEKLTSIQRALRTNWSSIRTNITGRLLASSGHTNQTKAQVGRKAANKMATFKADNIEEAKKYADFPIAA